VAGKKKARTDELLSESWIHDAQVVGRARIRVVTMGAARTASILGKVRLTARGCSRGLATLVLQLP
jgi:hypothetical protein